VAALAQSGGVSIGASVVRTEFTNSSATIEHQGNGTELVTIHVENSGALDSKDTVLDLILPSGWTYVGTSGDEGRVHTEDRPYGELVVWNLDPVSGGEAVDIRARLRASSDEASMPLFISLASAYSAPVYAQVAATAEERQSSLWSSWVRSLGSYATLTLREFWYRLTTGIRLGFGQM
jgi:hypothetical protein